MSIFRCLCLVNERVSVVGVVIFGVRLFVVEGCSFWGDGRFVLVGWEGLRRGGIFFWCVWLCV